MINWMSAAETGGKTSVLVPDMGVEQESAPSIPTSWIPLPAVPQGSAPRDLGWSTGRSAP